MLLLKGELGATVKDVNGIEIRRIAPQRCHSLLKAFIQLIMAQTSDTQQTVKKVDGTNQIVDGNSYNLRCNAGILTAYGLVIGSGEVNAVAMDDYKLENQMTANIGHQPPVFALENPDVATWQVKISRGFQNNTGATVNVKEVGLYTYVGGSHECCIDRTLYDVSFDNNETLTLSYVFSIAL